MSTDSAKSRVDMWLDAIMKMRQGIQMQYQDTVWAKGTWEDCNYDPENPPDFDKDLIWREKPTQNNLSVDEKFEEYLNVLRKIRVGIRMEYTSSIWNHNEYVEWNNIGFPKFDVDETWRECYSEHDEDEERNIRQITIIPSYSYDCSGNVIISLNIKMDDDAPETVHYVTPCNPFYIVI